MSELEATGCVIIRQLPKGEAPEWVRQAWVGLTLPCFPYSGSAGVVKGVITGIETVDHHGAVQVPCKEALALLAVRHPRAAGWWNTKGKNFLGAGMFAFALDDLTIVDGVQMQKIVQVTDEMMGDPHR